MIQHQPVYDRRPSTKRKTRRLRPWVYIALLIAFIGSIFSFLGYKGYATYSRDTSLVHTSMQHLQKGQALLTSITKGAFDAKTALQAKQEFSDATTNLRALNGDVALLPAISTSLPVYGTQLNTASHLVPLALNLSEVGMESCTLLALLFSRLHTPFVSDAQGLNKEDINVIQQTLTHIKTTFTLVEAEMSQVHGTNTSFDPRIERLVTTLSKDLPLIRTGLDTIDRLVTVAPTLLGINTPSYYLLEVLDSTELRPVGGLIGNYGIATVSNGRLVDAHITDVDLLDRPFEDQGKVISFPPAYTWFTLEPNFDLHNTGLDADFPTVAKYSESNYVHEGGKVPVQGVIAITPALIQRILLLTGPIVVPEYQETVTAQNLIARIHFHQLGGAAANEGDERVASPDGYSSLRKRFVSLLAEHLLTRVRQLAATDAAKFAQIFMNGLRAKDIQVYLNSSVAENVLHQYQLDGAIQAPPNDNMLVVDANVAKDKANSFITTNMNEQISIDDQGTATHHATLTYAWLKPGLIYGNPVYEDYVHIYVPNGSQLNTQEGWQWQGTSSGFNHEIWAGMFTLTFGQTQTITLTWTTHYTAKNSLNGWKYDFLVQRQAGTNWTLHLGVTLPTHAVIHSLAGGLKSSSKQTANLSSTLAENTNVEVTYEQ